METKGRLVAVVAEAPSEDADLVEVAGQAGFGLRESHDVLGNVLGGGGLGVADGGQLVGADDALVLSVLGDGIGDIHIDAAGEQPSGAALIVAGQPPVFQDHRRRGRRERRGGGFSLVRRGGFGWGWGHGLGRIAFGELARDRAAVEELDPGVGREQVKVLGIAAGEQMQIEVVAEDAGGDDGVLLVLGGKLGEPGVGFAVDDQALLDPADLVFIGFDLEEAAAVLDDLKGLAVDHLGDASGDGGYAVAQVGLASGDVDRIHLLMAKAGAAGKEGGDAEKSQ